MIEDEDVWDVFMVVLLFLLASASAFVPSFVRSVRTLRAVRLASSTERFLTIALETSEAFRQTLVRETD